MRSLLTAFAATLMLTACDDQEPLAAPAPLEEALTTSGRPADPDLAGGEEHAAPSMGTGSLAEDAFGDRYTLVEAPTVEDGALVVVAEYGGGCAEHTFEVVLRTRDDASPAVLELDLVHDDGGDLCRAIRWDEVTIDLAELMIGSAQGVLELNTPDGTWLVDLE